VSGSPAVPASEKEVLLPFRRTDAEVWDAVDLEVSRQERELELIASENHASAEVIAAMGTALTNKYAEGYPGRRYYGGCQHVDTVENLARDRAKALFASEAANVQPHSGTQANIAALMALAARAIRILSMSLDHGGHLRTGTRRTSPGLFYEVHAYGVEKGSERIDMDRCARSRAR
jgi:glycine hydroxymethyltransferase